MTVQPDEQLGTVAEPAAAPAPAGNPSLVALPTFLVGGISLGLWLFGYLPRDLPGGLIARSSLYRKIDAFGISYIA